MAEVTFSEASPSVIHTAVEMIKKYHVYLEEARIAFVFRSEEQITNGRAVWAQVSKVPAKIQIYMEFDYIVWVAENIWVNLSPNKREALIDHELCHMGLGSGGNWKIRQHEIQEFREILERHGAWNDNLFFNLSPVMEQPKLPGLDKITVSGAGRVATITGEQLDRLANKMLKQEEL